MKTVGIISQKGGCGKTTLSIHTATAATAAGLATLILDTDPQASSSKWGRWRSGADPDVIDCAAPSLVASKLAAAAAAGAELAVVDTPPHAEAMALAVGRACDLILIPCAPRPFELDAIGLTADLVRMAGKSAFVVWVDGPQRAPILYREAAEVVAGYGVEIAPVMMTSRAAFHHAAGQGQAAQEIEPGSRAAKEVAELWSWLSRQVGLSTLRRADTPTQAAA